MAAGIFIVAAAATFALAGSRPNQPAATATRSRRPPSTPGSPTAATPSAGANSSPTRSPTPSSTPTPLASPFGDCALRPGAGATLTAPLGDNFHLVVRVPNGWAREPLGASETQLQVLAAPARFSHQPTTIQVLSLFGYFPNQSPRDLAPMYYAPSVHPDVPSTELVGAVSDCQVEGDPAASFQYVRGDRGGYLVLFLHYNYLYGVQLEGAGEVDPLAVRDAKQILGSIQWTVTTPPAR
jgi:hypothetical protein